MTVTRGLIFQNTHPIFSLSWECVVSFLWNTEAACPIQIMTDTDQVRVLSRGISPSCLWIFLPRCHRSALTPPLVLPSVIGITFSYTLTAGLWESSCIALPDPSSQVLARKSGPQLCCPVTANSYLLHSPVPLTLQWHPSGLWGFTTTAEMQVVNTLP